MMRGVGWYRVGFAMVGCLAVLAACSGGSFLAEREPWRKEAEARCIGSGAVREGPGIARSGPIRGPGVCGTDYPFKVSALSQPTLLGYGEELRPPGSIPNAARQMPRWPVTEPSSVPTYEPRGAPRPVESRPLPPPPRNSAPAYEPGPRNGQPVSLDPPAPTSVPPEPYDFRRPYGASPRPQMRETIRGEPIDPASPAYDLSPEPYEHRRSMEGGKAKPKAPPRVQQRADPPPVETRARDARRPPPLGPSRGSPRVTGSVGSVTFTPTATLACPLVSALDEWFATAVQPAALRWFGQPVVEVRQISAYSCRGMNGNPRARISEHAFGNALDIASFTLANGRRITVKNGWRGAPEEQGFLRDVQASACDRFTTVLAPGSNRFHADHFHVDLMRRSGKACNPRAVSGEEVAARARAQYARQGRDPSFTGSVPKGTKRIQPTSFAEDKVGHQLRIAVPGEDGDEGDD